MNLSRSLGLFPFVVLSIAGCGSATDFADLSGSSSSTGSAAATGSSAAALTLTTADRVVAPGAEIYGCQDFDNPFGEDVAIVETTSTMTEGSHHMFAFVLPNTSLSLYGALTDCPAGGIEFHDYVHTSQLPQDHMKYPPGVGHVFPTTSGFRLMIHLLNTGGDPLAAHVELGVKHVGLGSVTGKAASMFLNNFGLQVPVGKSTQTASFTLPRSMMLLRAASHMHRHGAGFTATTNDGTILFATNVWDEPTPRFFDPPLSLKQGTTITWSCDFQNDTGKMLTFGESAATNEMCILSAAFFDMTGAPLSVQYPLGL